MEGELEEQQRSPQAAKQQLPPLYRSYAVVDGGCLRGVGALTLLFRSCELFRKFYDALLSPGWE